MASGAQPNLFDPILFATFSSLACIWISLISSYFAIPKGKYWIFFFVLLNSVVWIILNLGIYLAVEPKSAAINAMLLSNIVVLALISIGTMVYLVGRRQFDHSTFLPEPITRVLDYGLSHIDIAIIPRYAQARYVTIKEKKDAMSAVVRQISLTTIPSTIENLARIGLFEVRENGRFRILASHHIDAHRLPKLERVFSHDPSNPVSIVGLSAARKKVILIPDLSRPPDEYRNKYLITEENKLPGQKAEGVLCVPVFDDPAPITDRSRCIAVISVSCSQKNILSERHVKHLERYADKVRILLDVINPRIPIDPDVAYGVRVITISGEVASGKTTLRNALSKLMGPSGWRIASTGPIFRAYCKQNNLSEQDVDRVPDDFNRKFDSFQESMLAEEESLVIEGRLSGYLAWKLKFKDVLTVFCNLPKEKRIERYMKRYTETYSGSNTISQLEAERLVTERDKKDSERYRKLYGIDDYTDRKYYDVYLSTDDDPQILAQKVIEEMEKKDIR